MTRAEVFKLSAPFIAMGGVFVARRAMAKGFQATTGNEPPEPDNLDAPITQVILFAAGAAVAAAVINALIQRGVARAIARSEAPLPEPV